VQTQSAECRAWWQSLDAAVDEAGVRDAEAALIPGFEGLRSTRVLSALRLEAAGSQQAFAAWLQAAAQEDRLARSAEMANLPPPALASLGVYNPAAAQERSDRCREQGLQTLLASAALRDRLLAMAEFPSRYNPWSRAVGLYPLTRLPFFAGVQRWQDRHASAMKAWQNNTPPLTVWQAPASEHPGPMPSQRDALGLPQWSDAQARAWLAWHAPHFAVDTRGPFDRFGRPYWPAVAGQGPGSSAPEIDTTQAVVYQRVTTTRLDGRWLPQLVYTLWFPQRPASGPLDLLAGNLDGLVVRLTLDEQGKVLLLDTMHACGCYHLFLASSRLKPKPHEAPDEEWLFAPADLPDLQPGQTLMVQVSSGSHDVMGVVASARSPADAGAGGALRYGLDPEQALRSLPVGGFGAAGSRRSLYGPDGLVPGTERGERWLFWPMGITSAGAMRQWSHHATAFVGQRHFDDPDLLERRYERVP
jgi:hypothetical protein